MGASAALIDATRELVESADRLEILVDSSGDPVVHVVYKGEAGSVPVALSGEGTRRAIWFALELGLLRTGAVALVEEPEGHMHPHALGIVARALVAAANRGVQLFISTHSLALMKAILDATESAPDGVAIVLCEMVGRRFSAQVVEGTRQEFASLRASDLLWMPGTPQAGG